MNRMRVCTCPTELTGATWIMLAGDTHDAPIGPGSGRRRPPRRRSHRPGHVHAHIIETGTESYRLRTTKTTRRGKNPS